MSSFLVSASAVDRPYLKRCPQLPVTHTPIDSDVYAIPNVQPEISGERFLSSFSPFSSVASCRTVVSPILGNRDTATPTQISMQTSNHLKNQTNLLCHRNDEGSHRAPYSSQTTGNDSVLLSQDLVVESDFYKSPSMDRNGVLLTSQNTESLVPSTNSFHVTSSSVDVRPRYYQSQKPQYQESQLISSLAAPNVHVNGGGSGTKTTVCTSFFRDLYCKEDGCIFAHNIQELDLPTYFQLLRVVGGEQYIPPHFMGAASANCSANESHSVSAACTPHNISTGMPTHILNCSVGSGETPKVTVYKNSTFAAPSNISVQIGERATKSAAVSRVNSNQQGGYYTLQSSTRYGGDRPTSATTGGGIVPLSRPCTGSNINRRITSLSLPQHCRYPHSIPGSFYEHLNLKRTCDSADVDASYRRWRTSGYKAAKAIGEKEKADAMDCIVVNAKLVLSNTALRALYDEDLKAKESGALLVPSPVAD
eukprot:Tbor_TRINITY_DN5912_c0_g3::TRINITY_DN5912_c0_g3_i1::g.18707::m.18707